MKVFITGGTGFIGSHIVVELLGKGHEVTILARNPDKSPRFLRTPGITMVQGSLDDHETIRLGLKGQDACIHNAIYWEDAPTELEMKDTRASAVVFEAAASAGVKHLIYTSSTAVHRPFKPRMDEEARIAPDDLYGATKAASEALLSAFSYQTGMRCNTIRPGPTVGVPIVEGAPVSCDRRFKEIVGAVCSGDPVVVGRYDGRQFIGAHDLAKVYSAVLDSDLNRGVFLAVAREFVSWEQIALDAVRLGGTRSRVIVEDRGVSETLNLFDPGKIERAFGLSFEPRTSIQDHLRYLIERES